MFVKFMLSRKPNLTRRFFRYSNFYVLDHFRVLLIMLVKYGDLLTFSEYPGIERNCSSYFCLLYAPFRPQVGQAGYDLY